MKTIKGTLMLFIILALVFCFVGCSIIALHPINPDKKNDIDGEFTIIFDTQGGNEIEPITISNDSEILLPEDPIKEGYDFEGWYVDSDFLTKFDLNTKISSNITLYAKWISSGQQDDDYITITFDTQGGNEIAPIRISKNVVPALPNEPIKDDYTFDGWYTDKDCLIKFNEDTPIGSNIMLYAKWEPLNGTFDITIWVSSDDAVEIFQSQIDAFNAVQSEYKIVGTVYNVSEADAVTLMLTDVETGADIFLFAQDSLQRLIQVGALKALETNAKDKVISENDVSSVSSVMVGDKIYAYPLTSDNGYFMYYDKSIIQESSLDSLDAILADCISANKSFCFNIDSAWYMASFFFGAGCRSEWETDMDGNFISVIDTFNSEYGLTAMKGLNSLTNNSAWRGSDSASSFTQGAAVVVSGLWDAANAQKYLAENYGVAKLPYYTVDGVNYQLGSYSGSKLLGVKPTKDIRKAQALNEFALFLSNEGSQFKYYTELGWGPSNKNTQSTEEVQTNEALSALIDQNNHSTVQGIINGGWWDSAKVLASTARSTSDEGMLRDALDNYEKNLDWIIFAETAPWGVIGDIHGDSWSQDHPMVETDESGTWITKYPLYLTTSNAFLIRFAEAWHNVIYNNGAEITTDKAGLYWIKADTNYMTYELIEADFHLIGEFCKWATDSDIIMTDNGDGTFTVSNIELTAGSQFKVRAPIYNNDWAYDDFGTNGAYYTVSEQGIYTITVHFDLANLTWVYSVESTEQTSCTHTSNEWETVYNPTCTELGLEKRICKTCQYVLKERYIAALGHNYVDCVCTNCGKSNHDYANGICTNCGIEQPYTRKGNYIYFGTYPQSEVTNESLTSALTAQAGALPTEKNSANWTSYGYYIEGEVTDFMWYIDLTYGGEQYRGVYFTSYRPYGTEYSSSTNYSYQDDNGYYISTVYWFKYEPIKWRILSEEGGEALILCEMIIDSQEYYDNYNTRTINDSTVYANNYAYSTIRTFLNDTFYNTAFTTLEKELILLTTVDNSARSTNPDNNSTYIDSGTNTYACSNTSDYIFLLSEQEVTKSACGFSTSVSSDDSVRQKKTTDYAQCQGAGTVTSSDYEGNGRWWLRSPYCRSDYYARGVFVDGDATLTDYVYNTDGGVVPALKIKLN